MLKSGLSPVDQFDRLAMVARALTQDLGIDEVLEIVMHQGMAGSSASGAAFAFRHGDALLLAAAAGTTSASVTRLGPVSVNRANPAAESIRLAQPMWLPDREEALARFADLRLASPTSLAWASIPLLAGSGPFGAWSLSFNQPTTFSPEMRRFIMALADLAALALSRIFSEHVEGRVAGHRPPVLDGLVVETDDAVVVVNEDGVIIATNEKVLDLLGYRPETLIGRSVEVLVPPSLRPSHVRSRRRYAHDPTPRPFASGLDIVAMHADGTLIEVDVSLSPLSTPRDGPCVAAVLRPRDGVLG